MSSKTDAVNNLSAALECTKVYAAKVLDAVSKEIKRQLTTNGVAKIPGVGTLKVKVLAERVFRSPRTGQEVQKAARKTVRLAASQGMKAELAEGS